jgi:uroporphyrinogen-III synthase
MSIKNILISQKAPSAANPYSTVIEKYGVTIDFQPFFVIEPLTSREFRSYRINITDFTAVIFSSRTMIDAFFQLCEELRIKVSEGMKYFCTTEAVAMYLQKHIVYRKRKIFFGDGTPSSVIAQIGTKHKGEKFLIATSEDAPNSGLVKAFETSGLDFQSCVFVKPVYQDLKQTDINKYDMVVLYNRADVKSLYESYPEFKQENIKFFAYGKSVEQAIQDAGLTVELCGPTPQVPSVAKGLELTLEKQA